MTSGLEATDLACVRGERPVFKGVSFGVAPGQAIMLKGANGSGKSSLLRILAGLLKPVAGRLAWNGVAVADDAEGYRADLCFVGHLDAVKAVFTVEENLAFWATLGGATGADPAAALDRFGLSALADLPAQYLSSGQKRRVNLARIAISPATLWLLDEPTVGLDDAANKSLMALIDEHRRGGGMAIIATHVDLGIGDADDLRLAGGTVGAMA